MSSFESFLLFYSTENYLCLDDFDTFVVVFFLRISWHIEELVPY